MKKLLISSFLFFSCLNLVKAQATISGPYTPFRINVKYAPPVPTAASFEKYGNLPVSVSSGVPDITIPITSLKLKNFVWPISLSYHAGGVKPSDIATSIGLNWTLQAYGSVTKTSSSVVSTYTQGEIARNLTLSFEPITMSGVCQPHNEADIQIADDIIGNGGSTGLNIYNINTPLFNLRALENGATLPASNKKVLNNGGIVIDENGNRYEFSDAVQNLPSFTCNSPLQSTYSVSTNYSFYLSKILTYDGDTINFRYSNYYYYYNRAPLTITKGPTNANPINYCGPLNPEETICNNSYGSFDKRLDEIETSTGEIIRFFYMTRLDLNGGLRVHKIQIIKRINGIENVINNIYLSHDYFGSGSNPDDLRLRLNEVKYHDKNDNFVNSYKFYYEEGVIPSRLTPDYNLTINSSYNYPSVSATVNISKAGSLKRIQYPTGGETIFSYEVLPALGRLRISSIQDFSSENGLINYRRFQYNDNGGPAGYPALFSRVENYYNVVDLDPATPNNRSIQLCTRFHIQNEPLNNSNGYDLTNSVFFPNVTEFFGANGKNGKIEYTYGFPNGYPSPSPRDFTPMEPLLISKRIYEATSINNYALVSESLNSYEFPGGSANLYEYPPDTLKNSIWVKKLELLRPYIEYTSPQSTNKSSWCAEYYQDDYRVTSVPVRLIKNTEKIFSKESSQVAQTIVTDYFYDDLLNLNPSRVEVFDSKGNKQVTRNWFPTMGNMPITYSPSTAELIAINALKNSNNIVTPYYTEAFTNNTLLSKKVTSFNLLSSGKAFVVSEKIFPTGTTSFKETKILQYNTKNSPIEILDERGIKSSIIYNSLSQKVIATAVNCGYNEIAYTGFELNEEQTFSNLPSARVSGGITGTASYLLSSGNIVKSGLPSSNYNISCWAKNGTLFVNGIPVSSVITVNGWTLYRGIVSATQITISGTAQIDELRIHPLMAGVKTYTYDLFGITSINDERNMISYYEYDATGKMIRTRDQNNNILKESEFKYIDQKANWQSTGLTRCKPCDLNQSYTSNIQQIQEKDNNNLSATYNQLRWVDYGATAPNCGLADFQNTNTYRCATYISEGQTRNSGWKERMKKDMNPCSPTYNQTVWVLSHADVSGCQPPYVFAKFSVNPVSVNLNESYSDFIVEFFSDYECTIPVSVNNLTVNFSYQETVFSWNTGWNTTQSNQLSVVCNGTSTVISAGFLSNYLEWGQDWEDLNNPIPRVTYSYMRSYIASEGAMYDLGKY